MSSLDWISTQIKGPYLDEIIAGTKKIERRVAKEYWNVRLEKYLYRKGLDLGIVLISGQRVHRFRVTEVTLEGVAEGKVDIAGEKCDEWFEIHLGEEIKEKTTQNKLEV